MGWLPPPRQPWPVDSAHAHIRTATPHRTRRQRQQQRYGLDGKQDATRERHTHPTQTRLRGSGRRNTEERRTSAAHPPTQCVPRHIATHTATSCRTVTHSHAQPHTRHTQDTRAHKCAHARCTHIWPYTHTHLVGELKQVGDAGEPVAGQCCPQVDREFPDERAQAADLPHQHTTKAKPPASATRSSHNKGDDDADNDDDDDDDDDR
jgi:hypothetical protein